MRNTTNGRSMTSIPQMNPPIKKVIRPTRVPIRKLKLSIFLVTTRLMSMARKNAVENPPSTTMTPPMTSPESTARSLAILIDPMLSS